jgi:plasmid stability protein
MSSQPLTLNIPDPLYRLLRERAERSNRSVEAETVELLATAVPAAETLPADLAGVISPLALLSDEELWQAARSRLAPELAGEMEDLHRKRQQEGLSEAEAQTLARLVRQYERAMLVRAQAAALLRQRGQDVSELLRQP